jgi:hypothetical protein
MSETFVKDVDGRRILLTPHRVAEYYRRDGENYMQWYVSRAEIRRAVHKNLNEVTIRHARDGKTSTEVGFGGSGSHFRIGCHTFSKRTWKKILKHAGVKRG